jgi:hypothetical protein
MDTASRLGNKIITIVLIMGIRLMSRRAATKEDLSLSSVWPIPNFVLTHFSMTTFGKHIIIL